MLRGLFVNNARAQDSIFESGFMAYQCLLGSKSFDLDYIEVSKEQRILSTNYDFYLFNYHPYTMDWLDTSAIKNLPGLKLTIVLEVSPNDPFVLCPANDFQAYVVLDPTVKHKRKNVHPFPRPLERINFKPEHKEKLVPVIGTFGFATKGKGFHHVVDAVNKEFDKAIVRINIPYGDFVPDSGTYAKSLEKLCKERAKPGIEVQVTNDFMSKENLIKWCAENTLNCFLYDRKMPGLSATTDQAIVSGRPLSVSDNETFRHITAYIKPYPHSSLKESIATSTTAVNQMNVDWSPENFRKTFENLLKNYPDLLRKRSPNTDSEFSLPQYRKTLFSSTNKTIRRYARKLRGFNLKKMINDKRNSKEII